MSQRFWYAAVLLPAVILVRPSFAQEHAHGPAKGEQLGKVTFPTTCQGEAPQRFERAVALLHSFWFEEADRAFTSVSEADPQCAMAHWGIAMTMLANPMTRTAPPPALFQRGLAAVERAQQLAGGASPREQLWIEAVAAVYRDHQTKDHRSRMLAQEEAFRALRAAHPEDLEASIFYARTLVANSPPTDRSFAKNLEAANILEPLFRQHPEHPGLAHYLIHAYDAPPIAKRGLDAARRYASIAPAAPHALHMPSHIFTRVGAWDESIETNRRSAKIEDSPGQAAHPMDYMVYGLLQQGRDREAKEFVDQAVGLPDRFYGGIIGYNAAAMPARFALERNRWEDAARLPLPTGALPQVEALTRFARAIGAARSGQPELARREVVALGELEEKLKAADPEWAVRVGAQRLAAAAWLAHAEGQHTDALRLGREAADLEETVEKHPVTPGPLLPARELYGDLLLAHRQPKEALAEYEKTLERDPNRARAISGAAQAAELAPDPASARKHYTELARLMEKADPERAEAARARAFTRP